MLLRIRSQLVDRSEIKLEVASKELGTPDMEQKDRRACRLQHYVKLQPTYDLYTSFQAKSDKELRVLLQI